MLFKTTFTLLHKEAKKSLFERHCRKFLLWGILPGKKVKNFDFLLFWVLTGSTLTVDGSPLLYLVFDSNLSSRGVQYRRQILIFVMKKDATRCTLILESVFSCFDQPISAKTLNSQCPLSSKLAYTYL